MSAAPLEFLIYQGWAEPGIPPANIVGYFGRVQTQTRNAADTVRLFMVAGMGHCGGGDGASTFDMLDAWAAGGKAPDVIPASRVRGGAVDRTRPLCAYPKYAVYKGTGPIEDAESLTCEAPGREIAPGVFTAP